MKEGEMAENVVNRRDGNLVPSLLRFEGVGNAARNDLEHSRKDLTLLTLLSRAWPAAPLAVLALLNLPMTSLAQARSSAQASASAVTDLSPVQRTRIQARQARFQKDMAALKADTKMTPAQKQAKYATLLQALDRDILAMLTPAQRTGEMRRRQIAAQFRTDIAALRADKTLTEAQKRSRYIALLQSADQNTLATLTPAQRAQALKQRHQQEEVRREGEDLQKSETPAQAKQIQDIAKATSAQMQSVIADKSLSEQTKVERITELRKQAQAKDMAILTPVQRAKYAHLQQLVSTPASH